MRVAAQRSNGDLKQSMRWKDFNARQSDSEDTEIVRTVTKVSFDDQGTSKASRRASQLFPSSLASSAAPYAAGPLSSDSATFKDSFAPNNPAAPYPFDSPAHHSSSNGTKQSFKAPPLTRLASGSSIPTTSTAATHSLSRSNTTSAATRTIPPTLASSSMSSNVLGPSALSTASISPTPPPGLMGELKGKTDSESSGAARGFRVTLDDPCWKVLPAALKKYKIDDDWKVYALVICFGTSGE